MSNSIARKAEALSNGLLVLDFGHVAAQLFRLAADSEPEGYRKRLWLGKACWCEKNARTVTDIRDGSVKGWA